MSVFSSYKKIFLLGFVIVILIAIPFSVYIAQKRQQIKIKAAASTTLSFEPASPTTKVGEILILDIVLDPGIGSNANQVSFVKLSISFNPEKFTTLSDSLAPNPASPNTLTSVLENPVYTSGKTTISLSIGADPTKVVTTKTKIAILQLKALSATDANNPSTSVTFGADTQVLSIAGTDQTSENVLSTTTPARVTIVSNILPTSTPTAALASATSTPTPTPLPVNLSSSPLFQGGSTQLTTGSATLNLVPVFETQPRPIVLLPQKPLPPTGPGENILGIGIVGTILMVIGGILFFSL